MKRYRWLVVLILMLAPAAVRADGMVIPMPQKVVEETGQKAVIWYEGKTETMILSTTFRGDPEEFAWVIPVPGRPDVTKARDELFTALDDYTRPQIQNPGYNTGGLALQGVSDVLRAPTVSVLETKKVDIYDIAILEANDAGALTKWLEGNGYEYPRGREMLLKYYTDKNWYFVAVKVSADAMGYAGGALSAGHAAPLAIRFASEGMVYPLKISGPGSKYNEDKIQAAFGWEQGYEGWNGGTLDQTTPWEGKRSYLLTVPSYGTATEGRAIATKQSPLLQMGENYVLSAYVKAESGSEASAMMQLSGTAGMEMTETEKITGSGTWKRLELPFTARANTQMMISLIISGKSNSKAYWDAVQLERGASASAWVKTEVVPNPAAAVAVNEAVGLQLYVFSNHKQYLPGFSTEYAGKMPAKDIARLAVADDGSPWITANRTMYLTKLTRTMRPEEMTDDLVLRDAADDSPVGGGSTGAEGVWRPVLVFGLLIGAEMIGFGYFLQKKKKVSK